MNETFSQAFCLVYVGCRSHIRTATLFEIVSTTFLMLNVKIITLTVRPIRHKVSCDGSVKLAFIKRYEL